MRGHSFRATNLLKHVKDKYGTIQDPGQSGRSSGGAGVVVVVVLVVAGGLGLGRGLDGVTPEAAPRVLSQHTEPLWQLDVWAIRTDGRSQNAAIMLMRQKPGQRGSGSWDDVLGRLQEIRHILIMMSESHRNEIPSLTLLPIYPLHAHVNTHSKSNSSSLHYNSMVWVCERTIPTERPPLVSEVIANFCG
jgi:hypothetical protein